MANGKNVIEFQRIENVTYTYVSAQTLEPEFPGAELTSVVRQPLSGPLRRRSPKEMARLQEHPFFQELDPVVRA
jgi:hypothetical protein